MSHFTNSAPDEWPVPTMKKARWGEENAANEIAGYTEDCLGDRRDSLAVSHDRNFRRVLFL